MKALIKIGYKVTKPKSEGSDIYIDDIEELDYYADILDNSKKWETSDSINDDITISNKISIISNPFCMNNLGNIAYVIFLGAKWKVKDIKIQFPRIILSVGGLYND